VLIWEFGVLFLEFVFWVRKDLDLGLERVFFGLEKYFLQGECKVLTDRPPYFCPIL
jgi:hypothetical protein